VLNIPATATTPKIAWDDEAKTLSVSGESYPENSFAFYAPVFEWLSQTLPTAASLRLSVDVRYMNSSSTKCMLDIIDLLGEAAERGCAASIAWLYEEDNERARDLAEEFLEDVEIPYTIVPVKVGPR
jgi:hypothetical protein